MFFWSIHPGTQAILAWADGELSGARRRRVADHLASCAPCQRTLALQRSIDAASARVAAGAPPSDLLDRILTSRGAGRSVILPSGDMPEVAKAPLRRPAGRLLYAGRLLSAAAAALILAVAFASRISRLSATALDSELLFTPSSPTLGQPIEVHYRPFPSIVALIGQPEVALRARLRTRYSESYDDGVQITTVARLKADGDRYSGRFILPDSVVFAALVVERVDGTVVDDRRGQQWVVMVHDDSGRPVLDALEQRIKDMLGRSWEDARATGLQMSALYPDSVQSLNNRRFFAATLGRTAEASTVDSQIARVEREARTRDRLSGDDLAALLWLTVRDTVASRYWLARTEREAPRHGVAATYRALIFARAHYATPRIGLAYIDSLWNEIDDKNWKVADRLSNFALELAALVGDDVSYLRWNTRRTEWMPWLAAGRAIAVAGRPGLRKESERLLREALVGPGRPRKLEETIVEHAAALAATRRRVQAALGRTLIAEGRKRDGLDMLAMAAREGWDLALFRAVMRARAEAGELGDALEVGGLIAVDPRTAPALADSIATVGRNRWGDSAWNAAVMAGRERLREFTMTKALDRQVRGAPVVEDSSGRDVSLAAQLGDREAVVVFWSRDCAPALEALPALDSMATHLARTGIPMVLVVDEKPSMEFRRFMESKGATVRVLHDVKGEAKLAYGNFGTPSTYVLDSRKRIRFANIGSATDLPVQLAALREERDRSERSLPPQSVTRR